MLAQLINVFKLRIGLLIAITAVAGYAVTPGVNLQAWEILLLGIVILMSSASAGAFNQYIERDLDSRMARTRSRPFVTGSFKAGQPWLWGIALLLILSVVVANWMFNAMVAFHAFMGAFTYGVIYTMWLKRRSAWNIVIGGLAGSFAVLAGAAAADPGLSPSAIILATVLFLWTPPHFWSLAIALHKDYAEARVPMLPVVVGDKRAAWIILANTIALVGVSLLPAFYDWGLGWFYLACALIGGVYFIYKNILLVREPTRKKAMGNFFASLIQLTLVLIGSMLDIHVV